MASATLAKPGARCEGGDWLWLRLVWLEGVGKKAQKQFLGSP